MKKRSAVSGQRSARQEARLCEGFDLLFAAEKHLSRECTCLAPYYQHTGVLDRIIGAGDAVVLMRNLRTDINRDLMVLRSAQAVRQ
jgi:hypothetical protein